MGWNSHLSDRAPRMSHPRKRGFFSYYNPLRRFRKAHRGQANPFWVMSETAPFQVPLTIYFTLFGLTNLLQGLGITPNSVDQAYSRWIILAWAIFMFVGSALSLVGRYTQKFRMESAGLGLLLSSCGVVVVAVMVVAGWNGLLASGAFAAIGAGCVIRMIVIAKHHKAQRIAAQMIRTEQNGDGPYYVLELGVREIDVDHNGDAPQ